MKTRLFICLAAMIAFGSSCAKQNQVNPDVKVLGGNGVILLEKGDLSLSESSVLGTGAFVFTTEIGPDANLNKNFVTKVRLEEGGEVTLNLFTQLAGKAFSKGVQITLSRTGDKLSAKAQSPTGSADIEKLNGQDATGDIEISVDVHNTEGHVLVWSGAGVRNWAKDMFTEDSAMLNSEDLGKGAGNVWGISLKKASVLEAVVRDAQFED